MSNVQHYYNDLDPVACEWTRELIRDGLIPDGDVDCRSICEVQADEIRGYTQWHFFVGISGWPLALRLAGVDPGRSLLSGSCPCPPFSSAGKKQACPACGGRPVPCPRRTGYFICIECEHAWFADARHLWPELWRLIRDVRPPAILGEQVAGPDGLLWLAGVRGSLERIGYGVGAADIPACAVGSPHKRQRLFWGAALPGRGTKPVADVSGEGCRRRVGRTGGRNSDEHERLCHAESVAEFGGAGVRAQGHRRVDGATGEDQGAGDQRQRVRVDAGDGIAPVAVADPLHSQRRTQRVTDGRGSQRGDATSGVGAEGGAEPVGNAIGAGSQGRGAGVRGEPGDRACGGPPATAGGPQPLGDTNDEPRAQRDIGPEGRVATSHRANTARSGAACVDPWSGCDIILCGDGKHRRIPKGSAQSCVLELADGLPDPVVGSGLPCSHAYPLAPTYPGRVALLKGIGNAIVPAVGAVFVRAFFEAVEDQNG